jgi:NhaP-type Na+/H+ or K+/H+ antiporter
MTKEPKKAPARSGPVSAPPWETRGALTGALLGAVCRPVVVSAFWLPAAAGGAFGRHQGPWAVVIVLLTSCAIGLAIGFLAGWVAASRRNPIVGPVIGAIVGAALAFSSSILTCFCLCVVVTDGRPGHQPDDVVLYLATMALTGAFPGFIGGLVGNWVRRKQTTESSNLQNGEKERPVDGPSDPTA